MTKYEVMKFDREFMGWESLETFDDLDKAKAFYRKERNKIVENAEDTFIHMETILDEDKKDI